MRLLFVTPFYFPDLRFGGPPQKIHAVARGLTAAGHDVRVLTFDHSRRAAVETKQIDGISVQYLPWRGRGLRQFPSDLEAIRRETQDADVVHCYGLYTALIPLAARAARRAGVPIVQEPLGMYPPRARNQPAKRLYNAVISRRILNNAAALIAASESEANDLQTFIPEAEIVHRRNGIDVDAFANLPHSNELRETWHIRSDERIVLFVGRLSPIKNLEELIRAFARLKVESEKSKVGTIGIAKGGARNGESGGAKLILVGPGEPQYEQRLRALVARKGIADRVVFAGPLYEDQQKAAFAAADLFVLPSLNESFGNASAEAVAAGVPVLLTDTCGIAPLIHGRAGMAVPLGIESLAEGLRLMLTPEIRDQMTARREEVKRELSWEEPVRQTIELYERIVAQSRKDKG